MYRIDINLDTQAPEMRYLSGVTSLHCSIMIIFQVETYPHSGAREKLQNSKKIC